MTITKQQALPVLFASLFSGVATVVVFSVLVLAAEMQPSLHAELGKLFSGQWAGLFVIGTFSFLSVGLVTYVSKRTATVESVAKLLQALLIVSVASIALFFSFFALSAFV